MKKLKRSNVLLSKQEDKVLCTAIKNYCTLSNDDQMKICIDEGMKFFKGSPIHLKIFNDFLINPNRNRIRFCIDNYISEPGFYIYRREIIWRVAMIAYAMDIFSI